MNKTPLSQSSSSSSSITLKEPSSPESQDENKKIIQYNQSNGGNSNKNYLLESGTSSNVAQGRLSKQKLQVLENHISSAETQLLKKQLQDAIQENRDLQKKLVEKTNELSEIKTQMVQDEGRHSSMLEAKGNKIESLKNELENAKQFNAKNETHLAIKTQQAFDLKANTDYLRTKLEDLTLSLDEREATLSASNEEMQRKDSIVQEKIIEVKEREKYIQTLKEELGRLQLHSETEMKKRDEVIKKQEEELVSLQSAVKLGEEEKNKAIKNIQKELEAIQLEYRKTEAEKVMLMKKEEEALLIARRESSDSLEEARQTIQKQAEELSLLRQLNAEERLRVKEKDHHIFEATVELERAKEELSRLEKAQILERVMNEEEKKEIQKGKDTVSREKQIMEERNNNLQKEVSRVSKERDIAMEDYKPLLEERDALLRNKFTFKQTAESFEKMKNTMQEERNAWEREKALILDEKDQISIMAERRAQENERLVKENLAMEEEMRQLNEEKKDIGKQNEALAKTLSDAEGQKETLVAYKELLDKAQREGELRSQEHASRMEELTEMLHGLQAENNFIVEREKSLRVQVEVDKVSLTEKQVEIDKLLEEILKKESLIKEWEVLLQERSTDSIRIEKEKEDFLRNILQLQDDVKMLLQEKNDMMSEKSTREAEIAKLLEVHKALTITMSTLKEENGALQQAKSSAQENVFALEGRKKILEELQSALTADYNVLKEEVEHLRTENLAQRNEQEALERVKREIDLINSQLADEKDFLVMELAGMKENLTALLEEKKQVLEERDYLIQELREKDSMRTLLTEEKDTALEENHQLSNKLLEAESQKKEYFCENEQLVYERSSQAKMLEDQREKLLQMTASWRLQEEEKRSYLLIIKELRSELANLTSESGTLKEVMEELRTSCLNYKDEIKISTSQINSLQEENATIAACKHEVDLAKEKLIVICNDLKEEKDKVLRERKEESDKVAALLQEQQSLLVQFKASDYQKEELKDKYSQVTEAKELLEQKNNQLLELIHKLGTENESLRHEHNAVAVDLKNRSDEWSNELDALHAERMASCLEKEKTLADIQALNKQLGASKTKCELLEKTLEEEKSKKMQLEKEMLRLKGENVRILSEKENVEERVQKANNNYGDAFQAKLLLEEKCELLRLRNIEMSRAMSLLEEENKLEKNARHNGGERIKDLTNSLEQFKNEMYILQEEKNNKMEFRMRLEKELGSLQKQKQTLENEKREHFSRIKDLEKEQLRLISELRCCETQKEKEERQRKGYEQENSFLKKEIHQLRKKSDEIKLDRNKNPIEILQSTQNMLRKKLKNVATQSKVELTIESRSDEKGVGVETSTLQYKESNKRASSQFSEDTNNLTLLKSRKLKPCGHRNIAYPIISYNSSSSLERAALEVPIKNKNSSSKSKVFNGEKGQNNCGSLYPVTEEVVETIWNSTNDSQYFSIYRQIDYLGLPVYLQLAKVENVLNLHRNARGQLQFVIKVLYFLYTFSVSLSFKLWVTQVLLSGHSSMIERSNRVQTRKRLIGKMDIKTLSCHARRPEKIKAVMKSLDELIMTLKGRLKDIEYRRAIKKDSFTTLPSLPSKNYRTGQLGFVSDEELVKCKDTPKQNTMTLKRRCKRSEQSVAAHISRNSEKKRKKERDFTPIFDYYSSREDASLFPYSEYNINKRSPPICKARVLANEAIISSNSENRADDLQFGVAASTNINKQSHHAVEIIEQSFSQFKRNGTSLRALSPTRNARVSTTRFSQLANAVSEIYATANNVDKEEPSYYVEIEVQRNNDSRMSPLASLDLKELFSTRTDRAECTHREKTGAIKILLPAPLAQKGSSSSIVSNLPVQASNEYPNTSEVKAFVQKIDYTAIENKSDSGYKAFVHLQEKKLNNNNDCSVDLIYSSAKDAPKIGDPIPIGRHLKSNETMEIIINEKTPVLKIAEQNRFSGNVDTDEKLLVLQGRDMLKEDGNEMLLINHKEPHISHSIEESNGSPNFSGAGEKNYSEQVQELNAYNYNNEKTQEACRDQGKEDQLVVIENNQVIDHESGGLNKNTAKNEEVTEEKSAVMHSMPRNSSTDSIIKNNNANEKDIPLIPGLISVRSKALSEAPYFLEMSAEIASFSMDKVEKAIIHDFSITSQGDLQKDDAKFALSKSIRSQQCEGEVDNMEPCKDEALNSPHSLENCLFENNNESRKETQSDRASPPSRNVLLVNQSLLLETNPVSNNLAVREECLEIKRKDEEHIEALRIMDCDCLEEEVLPTKHMAISAFAGETNFSGSQRALTAGIRLPLLDDITINMYSSDSEMHHQTDVTPVELIMDRQEINGLSTNNLKLFDMEQKRLSKASLEASNVALHVEAEGKDSLIFTLSKDCKMRSEINYSGRMSRRSSIGSQQLIESSFVVEYSSADTQRVDDVSLYVQKAVVDDNQFHEKQDEGSALFNRSRLLHSSSLRQDDMKLLHAIEKEANVHSTKEMDLPIGHDNTVTIQENGQTVINHSIFPMSYEEMKKDKLEDSHRKHIEEDESESIEKLPCLNNYNKLQVDNLEQSSLKLISNDESIDQQSAIIDNSDSHSDLCNGTYHLADNNPDTSSDHKNILNTLSTSVQPKNFNSTVPITKHCSFQQTKALCVLDLTDNSVSTPNIDMHEIQRSATLSDSLLAPANSFAEMIWGDEKEELVLDKRNISTEQENVYEDVKYLAPVLDSYVENIKDRELSNNINEVNIREDNYLDTLQQPKDLPLNPEFTSRKLSPMSSNSASFSNKNEMLFFTEQVRSDKPLTLQVVPNAQAAHTLVEQDTLKIEKENNNDKEPIIVELVEHFIFKNTQECVDKEDEKVEYSSCEEEKIMLTSPKNSCDITTTQQKPFTSMTSSGLSFDSREGDTENQQLSNTRSSQPQSEVNLLALATDTHYDIAEPFFFERGEKLSIDLAEQEENNIPTPLTEDIAHMIIKRYSIVSIQQEGLVNTLPKNTITSLASDNILLEQESDTKNKLPAVMLENISAIDTSNVYHLNSFESLHNSLPAQQITASSFSSNLKANLLSTPSVSISIESDASLQGENVIASEESSEETFSDNEGEEDVFLPFIGVSETKWKAPAQSASRLTQKHIPETSARVSKATRIFDYNQLDDFIDNLNSSSSSSNSNLDSSSPSNSNSEEKSSIPVSIKRNKSWRQS